MISKSSKFPMRAQFVAFRQKASKLITPHTLIYRQKSTSSARMSVVVPKKCSKSAVTRNWLKRLTYNTLWPLLKDQKIDAVVVYKPLPLKKNLTTKQQIIAELKSLGI